MSKVLVFNKVYDFMANSISPLSYQFGFTKNCSTFKQLLLYNDFLSSAYDNHVQADSIFTQILGRHLIQKPMGFSGA